MGMKMFVVVKKTKKIEKIQKNSKNPLTMVKSGCIIRS